MKTKLLVKTINSYYEHLNLDCRVEHHDGISLIMDTNSGACLECDIDLHKTLEYVIRMANVQMKLDRANEASKEAQRHVLTFMVRDLGMETVQQWLSEIQESEAAPEGFPGFETEMAQMTEVSELFKPKRK
jgi:hypothetical protein